MGPVLIVEDNERNRRLVRDLLTLRDYSTVEAASGEQALDIIEREQPVLILLDVALPGMDGIELLGRLRARAETASTPIVAVTAFAMQGDRERLLAAGFDGYIAKPINVRTFVDELETVLQPST